MKCKVLRLLFNLIAIIQWYIGLNNLQHLYNVERGAIFKFNNANTMLQNILMYAFLIILLLIWNGIYKITTNFKRSVFVRNALLWGGIYFVILSVLFLIVYPGIWRWDEFFVLQDLLNHDLNYWQHFLTSIFYLLALCFIPIPSGIVFLQIIIIACTVGYVLAVTQNIFNGDKKVGLLILVFLLPPIIDNNFYPMRTTLYGYLELFFIVYCINLKYYRESIGHRDLFYLGIITSILSFWRSESIYYLLLGPIIVFYCAYTLNIKKKFIVYLFGLCLMSAFLYNTQKQGMINEHGKDYELTAIINPLSMMLQHDLGKNNIQTMEYLKDIDRVMSIDILKDNPSAYGINAFYKEGLIKDNYTDTEYIQMKKSYVKLVLSHFDIFLKYRLETFLATSAQIEGQRINIFDASAGFDVNSKGEYLNQVYKNFAEMKHNKPFFTKQRKAFIRLIECRNVKDINIDGKMYKHLYNLIPVIIFLILCAAICLYKRIYVLCLFLLSLVGRSFLIFLTAPARLFMYYFPIYLCGTFLIVLIVLGVIYEKTGRNICRHKAYKSY